MSGIFLNIVNMSISASWLVLAVLLLRLLLKKSPKWITVLLWGIVAIRLICPFSFESMLSLIPSATTISPEIMTDKTPSIDSGIPIINNLVNGVISESLIPEPSASANPLQILIPILSLVWITGIAVMLIYTVISYFRVKSKIGTAVIFRDNIYQSENVVSPFVLGIIRPKIYLPFNMSEQDAEHVIAHEKAHISRKDHLWKPFGFLVLTLHWFNPLMWVGYVLLCRDIELACDEKVVKELSTEQKADYSKALLTCSVNRRMIAACPLAFGEVGVRKRVKSVLNYKKPAFWIIATAIVASVVVAVCFLTNPRTTLNDELSVFIDMQVAEHNYSEGHSDGNFIVTNHKILDVDESLNKTTVYMWSMYHEYSYENGEIKLEAGSHIPTVITAKQTGTHRHYELVEYWTPGDGTDYAEDIKEKFPWYLHSKALDSQRYAQEQKAFCENAAKEYFAAYSDVSGENIPANLQSLRGKYPQFFGVSTDGGLTVDIWQTARNSYRCYLMNSFMDAISDNSFAYEVGATIAEMRAILTTYEIENKDITIRPVNNPLSSYRYEIDDAYRAKIEELFWENENTFESTVSYANWTEDSEIWLGALNTPKMAVSGVKHLPIYKFDTLEDLEHFKNTFSSKLTMDSGYDEVPSFNNVTAKYDNLFFEENSLLLVYVSADNCTHRFNVQNVGYDEKSFYVHIEETTKAETVDTAMAGWFITVAVSDELIKDCTNFDADLNNGIDVSLPKYESEEDLTQPPELKITTKEVSVQALMGTASWSCQNSDGSETAMEVGGPHPLEQIKRPNLALMPMYFSKTEPFKVELQFNTAPDKVTVHYWEKKSYENTSVKSKEVDVSLENNDWYAKLNDGNYIYEVVAEWNNAETYGGTVRYCFSTASSKEETSSVTSFIEGEQTQGEETSSRVEENFTYAVEKTVKNAYILHTEFPYYDLDDFGVIRSLNGEEILGLNSLLGSPNIAIKSINNWVKFSPNHPNKYAMAVEFTDNTCIIIAIHFQENSGTYYIAMADSERYDKNADYKGLEYTRGIASEELGKYLSDLIF